MKWGISLMNFVKKWPKQSSRTRGVRIILRRKLIGSLSSLVEILGLAGSECQTSSIGNKREQSVEILQLPADCLSPVRTWTRRRTRPAGSDKGVRVGLPCFPGQLVKSNLGLVGIQNWLGF